MQGTPPCVVLNTAVNTHTHTHTHTHTLSLSLSRLVCSPVQFIVYIEGLKYMVPATTILSPPRQLHTHPQHENERASKQSAVVSALRPFARRCCCCCCCGRGRGELQGGLGGEDCCLSPLLRQPVEHLAHIGCHLVSMSQSQKTTRAQTCCNVRKRHVCMSVRVYVI